jgi:hypothetical protein
MAYVSYVAQLLRPWVWPAAFAAVAAFVVFGVLHLWAYGPGIRMAQRALCKDPSGASPTLGRRIAAGSVCVLVRLATFLSGLIGRLSLAAATVACAGLLAGTLVSPSSAGASGSMLNLAQQALRQAIPAEYAKVADLASPKVATKDGKTTYTFSVPAKASGKSSKAKTYSVTLGPDGAAIGDTP